MHQVNAIFMAGVKIKAACLLELIFLLMAILNSPFILAQDDIFCFESECFFIEGHPHLGRLDHNSINQAFCTETDCFFPDKSLKDYDIHIEGQINWDSNKTLIIHTRGNIIFKKGAKLISTNDGSIILKAGMEPADQDEYRSTVIFEDEPYIYKNYDDKAQLQALGHGKIKIYYNPHENPGDKFDKFKYNNPQSHYYSEYIKVNQDNYETYMLVNDVYDLQNIIAILHMNFALSRDIDATPTRMWNEGKGFYPIKDMDRKYGECGRPFSGDFDGNGHTITGLYINRPNEKDVGLFGMVYGGKIKNLTIKDFNITGDKKVGGLVGLVERERLINIKIIDSKIKGKDIVGGLIGTAAEHVRINDAQITSDIKITADNNGGIIAGNINQSFVILVFPKKQSRDDFLERYQLLGSHDEHSTVCMKVLDDQQKQICLKTSPAEYNGMVMTVPYKNTPLPMVTVLTGSKALDPDQQKEHVLAAEYFYAKQEIESHGENQKSNQYEEL